MSDRREYGLISKRSKQILGEDVLPKAASTGAQTGCSQRAADAEQKEKRRSQVLRAQRTHRQRTQTYIKMLEREVLRLRESERAALATVDSQRRQVDELLRILAVTNTPPISATSDDGTSGARGGIVTASMAGNRGVHVDVQFPDLAAPDPDPVTAPPGFDYSPASNPGDFDFRVPTAADDKALTSLSSSPLEGGPEVMLAVPKPLLSDPRVGIEFILRLETDCMDHLRGKHLDHVHDGAAASESGISGHISTASLSLWQQHHGHPASSASYQISSSELERLLSSSLNLGLASPEITPVQVWNRIRWLALPGGADALERLTQDLKAHTFCVGFGAVLHEAVVEDILKRYYPGLPPTL